MIQEQMMKKLNDNKANIEALFSSTESPTKITHISQGSYTIARHGILLDLTEEEIKGVELYLNLAQLLKDDKKEQATT